jgi:uncharacterized membrane protein
MTDPAAEDHAADGPASDTSKSDTGRVEAFSDGVLAVAITLLVLDLKVPHVGDGSLWDALLKQWPAYAAYLTSFLIIGIMWANHHGIFRQIRFVDRSLMLLNLLLLMSIVAIPFGASLVSEYLTEPGHNGNIAMATYSGISLMVAISYGLIWGYALWHPDLLEPFVDVSHSRKTFPRFAGVAIFYAVLIVVSLLNAYVALIVTFLLALYYAFDQLQGAARR